jgi:hypothetical protein
MSIRLLSANGESYVGITINDTITRIAADIPAENLYNHSAYPSVEDMVEHATGEPWTRLGDSGSTWRGSTGSDQLFMAAIQAYFSSIRRSHSRDNLHPMSLEWETLIHMGTLDNQNPPPALLQQAFRHSAGLAANLLEALDDQSRCHKMLAEEVSGMQKKYATLMEFTKRKLSEGEKKVFSLLLSSIEERLMEILVGS